MIVFEMLKDEEDPEKWKKVEDTLGIEAVTKEGITEILLRAGYQNIRTYTKSETSWMCAVAEKE